MKFFRPDRPSVSLLVAPLVGAWIEMREVSAIAGENDVAPLVGAWIEIRINCAIDTHARSLPSWERGLKLLSDMAVRKGWSRSPRGSVD